MDIYGEKYRFANIDARLAVSSILDQPLTTRRASPRYSKILLATPSPVHFFIYALWLSDVYGLNRSRSLASTS